MTYMWVSEWMQDSANVMTNIVNGGRGITKDLSVDEQYAEILRLLKDLTAFLNDITKEEE